jgi:hypothetical protein
LWEPRLSPLEQFVVGTWYTDSKTGAFVLELTPDRRCEFRRVDGDQIGPGRTSLSGRWRSSTGGILFDWRTGWDAVLPVRIVQSGKRWGPVPMPQIRRPHPGEQVHGEVSEDSLVTGNRTWRRSLEPHE